MDLLQTQLPVSENFAREGISSTALEGRFQVLGESGRTVLDVAHNEQAAEILAAALESLPVVHRTHAIIGMLSTKKHIDFLRPLFKKIDFWHFISLPDPRSAPADVLERALKTIQPGRTKSYCHSSVSDALFAITKSFERPDESLIISGSSVTVGCALPLLQRDLR